MTIKRINLKKLQFKNGL